MKEIILDTETTGLSTKEGHRIVEIGCIELDNLVPTKNKFHCYLNPGRKVSEKALEVHGYTDEFLSRQKRFDQIVDEFLKLDIDYSEPFHLIEEPNGKTDKIEKYDDELAIIEFLFAASENDVDGLRQLVAKGIPINVGDKDSRTSLHLAAAEGSLDAVIYLINHGHLLFVRDRWGATPLDEAIRENRDGVIEYIKKLSN